METLLLMTIPCARKLGNISCGHKMFLNKIRNSFCVPDTKFASATNFERAGKRGNICVGNNVSSFASTFKLPIVPIGLFCENDEFVRSPPRTHLHECMNENFISVSV